MKVVKYWLWVLMVDRICTLQTEAIHVEPEADGLNYKSSETCVGFIPMKNILHYKIFTNEQEFKDWCNI